MSEVPLHLEGRALPLSVNGAEQPTLWKPTCPPGAGAGSTFLVFHGRKEKEMNLPVCLSLALSLFRALTRSLPPFLSLSNPLSLSLSPPITFSPSHHVPSHLSLAMHTTT